MSVITQDNQWGSLRNDKFKRETNFMLSLKYHVKVPTLQSAGYLVELTRHLGGMVIQTFLEKILTVKEEQTDGQGTITCRILIFAGHIKGYYVLLQPALCLTCSETQLEGFLVSSHI